MGMGMGRLGLLRLGPRLGMGLWLGIWLEPILGLATLLVQPVALRLFRLHLPEPVAERAERRRAWKEPLLEPTGLIKA